MKINGEKILGFYVIGEESGTLTCKPLETLKECYDFIKEDKKVMKRESRGTFNDTYYIQIETEKNIYGDYKLKKYKNKYSLK